MNTTNNKILYGAIAGVFLLVFVVLGLYLYDQQRKNETPSSGATTTETEDTMSEEEAIQSFNTSFLSEKGVAVTLSSPTRGATVASPLSVAGNVPGSWSHEGQFTIRVLDNESNILAESPATLSGDWMTTQPVPFTAELEFAAPAAGSLGLLVLEKANPSDLEANADSLSVPIQF